MLESAATVTPAARMVTPAPAQTAGWPSSSTTWADVFLLRQITCEPPRTSTRPVTVRLVPPPRSKTAESSKLTARKLSVLSAGNWKYS